MKTEEEVKEKLTEVYKLRRDSINQKELYNEYNSMIYILEWFLGITQEDKMNAIRTGKMW